MTSSVGTRVWANSQWSSSSVMDDSRSVDGSGETRSSSTVCSSSEASSRQLAASGSVVLGPGGWPWRQLH